MFLSYSNLMFWMVRKAEKKAEDDDSKQGWYVWRI